MNESTNSVNPANAQQQAQLDLLHSVLGGDASLPWDHYSPATAQYLEQLEQDAAMSDEIEIDSQWSRVEALAAALWEAPATNLLAALTQKFGTRMPQQLLAQMASQAQSAAASGQALIDQLVSTAQAAVTDLMAEDLQVMARPMAMAMRSGEAGTVDEVVASVRSAEWDNLSEMEQARLSLAIARYALAELEASD